jgi:hypothetical protein
VKGPTVTYSELRKLGACAVGRATFIHATGGRKRVDVWTIATSRLVPVADVRWYARNTPRPAVLTTLSTHADDSVRWYVAANGRTPTAIVRMLATDSDEYVKERAVATLARRGGVK